MARVRNRSRRRSGAGVDGGNSSSGSSDDGFMLGDWSPAIVPRATVPVIRPTVRAVNSLVMAAEAIVVVVATAVVLAAIEVQHRYRIGPAQLVLLDRFYAQSGISLEYIERAVFPFASG